MTFWGNDIICILFFFAICFNFVLLSLFFFRKDRLEGQRVITTQSMLGRASKRAKKAEQAPCPAFLVPSYHPTSLCVCVALPLSQPSLLKERKEWSCSPPVISLEIFLYGFFTFFILSSLVWHCSSCCGSSGCDP